VQADARLRELSQRHGIDVDPLRVELAKTIDEQGRLEEIAESHSCELAGWEAVARDLDDRRGRAAEALARLDAELMEIDGSFLPGRTSEEPRRVIREIDDAIERALTVRAESARFLLALGRAAREPSFPDGAVVTAALREIVQRLTDEHGAGLAGERGAGLTNDDALTIVAALAQVCGVLDAAIDDPVAALRARLGSESHGSDLKALFAARQPAAGARLEPGASFEEIARRTQAIALGLWPEEPA